MILDTLKNFVKMTVVLAFGATFLLAINAKHVSSEVSH